MMKADIEYLTAAESTTMPGLQSAIREVVINSLFEFDFYCKDNTWKVKLIARSGTEVLITWSEFLDIVHNVSQFVARESEFLIREKQE